MNLLPSNTFQAWRTFKAYCLRVRTVWSTTKPKVGYLQRGVHDCNPYTVFVKQAVTIFCAWSKTI